jgi:hypothetical protein
MTNITNAAFVVSVHYDDPYGAAHINLKWKGNHQIADFDLDRLGEVLNCETETENTGWVIVKFSYVLNNLSVAPLSQSGPPVLQSSSLSSLVSPGDEVPLVSDGERLNGFIGLKDRLKRVRDACNNIAFLPMTDRRRQKLSKICQLLSLPHPGSVPASLFRVGKKRSCRQ